MVKHHYRKRYEKIALKLDLHKINLSSVASKYIGETEKDLNCINEAEKVVLYSYLTKQMRFLNVPWVKAVIPIRPGKEEAAS